MSIKTISKWHNWWPHLDDDFSSPGLEHHIENEYYWPILKYPLLKRWVKQKTEIILRKWGVAPKVFLKEDINWEKIEGIIYVNFWPKEAKLEIMANWEYKLIEWLPHDTHQKKEAA